MKNLGKVEIERIRQSLSETCHTYIDNIQYVGSNRFLVREKHKERLFDENMNQIILKTDYSNIFPFVSGVAPVCIREFITADSTIPECKKFGLIDPNGRELLPCIYDYIRVKIDGHTELSLNGEEKICHLTQILNGLFNWNEAIPKE